MKKYIPIRNLHTENKYNLFSLLNDNSVDLDLLKTLDIDLSSEQEFSALLHPEVRYEVTDHCNATCIMCPREEHEDGRPHGIMNTDLYKNSIDEVVKLGAKKIVLTGFGEPMLDKGLEEKISYAKSKNLSTYIISNGSVLNSKRALSILEAGLDEIRISFYGMGADTYNKVMQGLDYEKTKKGLLSFIEKRDKNNFKCKIQLSYLTLPENEKDQDNFQKFWEPLVDYVEIWKPHNFGDGRSYRHRDDDVKSSCGRPSTGPLQIQWNGEVIPCCYDYNNKIVLGNAFQDSVLDILNGDKYKLLRYAHTSKKFNLFPYCDQCDQLLPHADALIYTNRHNLPAEEAVKLSNTDLYNLVDAKEFDENLR